MRRFTVEHIRIGAYHPKANGLVERFHRSTRDVPAADDLQTLGRARELIAAWVAQYNERRLHARLSYLTPAEFDRGDPTARCAGRTEKLARGRVERGQNQ